MPSTSNSQTNRYHVTFHHSAKINYSMFLPVLRDVYENGGSVALGPGEIYIGVPVGPWVGNIRINNWLLGIYIREEGDIVAVGKKPFGMTSEKYCGICDSVERSLMDTKTYKDDFGAPVSIPHEFRLMVRSAMPGKPTTKNRRGKRRH